PLPASPYPRGGEIGENQQPLYKKVYLMDKRSKPMLGPLMSLPFVFLGLIIISIELIEITGIIITNSMAPLLYAVIGLAVSIYFILMQKLEITYFDVVDWKNRLIKKN
ncbi:MAG: hypothetical protein WA063_03795, partial [Minisyncoccia bacterium]